MSTKQNIPDGKNWRIINISPLLSSRTAVFPGDTPFLRKTGLSFESGNHLELSAITSTLHIGAHADAPSHYHPEGKKIHERSLEAYLGPVQVIRVHAAPRARIEVAHLQGVAILAPRVLFRTDSFPNANHWRDDFNSLSPALLDKLAAEGVLLVGIDTPSVDPSDSKKLEAHAALFRHDFAVLEGLDLSGVNDGLYTLVALPLNIENGEASPVRAVLLPEGLMRDSVSTSASHPRRAKESGGLSN